MHVTPRNATKRSDPFIADPLWSLLQGMNCDYAANWTMPVLLCSLSLHASTSQLHLIRSLHSSPTSTTPDRRVPSDHTMPTRTGNNLSHRAGSFLLTCLRSMCSGGSRSNRSEAYRPIPDLPSAAQMTPTPSRRSESTPTRPTLPRHSDSFPIDPSSTGASAEALQTAVAQTAPTSVDPELDVIDGTYLCRMTRYPDGEEKWPDEIKLQPNQTFRACVDPTFGNCLTFLPPSQNPPTLESALRLDPNKNGMCFEETDTEYWIIGPDAEKDRTLNFPFALVTDCHGNVREVKEGPLCPTQGGSEVASDTHGSTGCPSTSLPNAKPPSTSHWTAKVPSCANEMRGARGLMRKGKKGWEERPKRGSIAAR
jgi:hypothetical protein